MLKLWLHDSTNRRDSDRHLLTLADTTEAVETAEYASRRCISDRSAADGLFRI